MELLERSVSCLRADGQRHVVVGDVLVQLTERVVFRARLEGVGVIVKTAHDAGRLQRELAALAMCRGTVDVPGLVEHLPGPPHVVVLTVLPGQQLQPASPDLLWSRAGAVLAALHTTAIPPDTPLRSISHDWAGYPSVTGRRAAELRERWPAVTSARVRQGLDAARQAGPEHSTFVHGDCQPAHFLHRDGEVTGVIDFGDAAIADPVWDLAVLTVHAPERLPAVLGGYAPANRLRDRVGQLVESYWLLRLLHETLWLLDRGFGIEPQLDRLRSLSG